MLLSEAKEILKQHGYICESDMRGDYIKGEKGGENFRGLSNDYTYEDALRYYASAIIGEEAAKNPNKVDTWFHSNLSNASQRARFKKTWETFEKFRQAGGAVLYRGIMLAQDVEVDSNKPGDCWSFNRSMPRQWVDDIWDREVEKFIHLGGELKDCKKVIFTGKTGVDNMDLPYSFWLAGRFERNECEVRLRDEKGIQITAIKELKE